MIRGILKVRFGPEGLALMTEIENIKDETLLEKIQETLERVETLDEVRKVYVQDTPAAENGVSAAKDDTPPAKDADTEEA
jgi:predicted RND superfamily exporter protein